MTKFLLLYFHDTHAWATMPPEEREQALQRMRAWREEPEHARLVRQSGSLSGADETISVFLGPAGHTEQPQVIPGPYLSTPESLNCYLVVEAANQDEVLALVESWPTGGAFEIMPIL